MKARTYYILSLLIIFILAFCGLIAYKYSTRKIMLGSYVFSNVIPKMDKVSSISIDKGDKEINLSLEDGLWRVQEASGYYANYVLLNSLFTDVYNSQYSSLIEDPNDELFSHPISLTFIDNKKVVDSVILGKKDDKHLYTFAKRGNDTFLITGKFVLPLDIMSWIQTPAFRFDEEDIMLINVETSTGEMKEVKINDAPMALKDYLGFVYFKNAIADNEFVLDGAGEARKFIVTSFEGLEVEFSILPKGDAFWGKISLRTTKMPTTIISDYVKQNAFLYDGWYFELPQDYAEPTYRFLNR